MKKALVILLAVIVLFSCTGCTLAAGLLNEALDSVDSDQTANAEIQSDGDAFGIDRDAYRDENESVQAEVAIPNNDVAAAPSDDAIYEDVPVEETPDEILTSLYTHMWLLNECMQETCGASLNRDVAYGRVYTSMDAMMNGDAPIDVIPRENITEVTDAIDATLYEVTNFSSNAQIRAYLEEYMTADLVDLLFYDQFEEFNGKLYMVYGSMGYGAIYYDIDSAWIMDIGDEYCTVVADLYYFDEYNGEVTMQFQKINGRWYMVEYQEDYIY